MSAESSEECCHGKRRSEEHTSELQSQSNLVCRLLLEKKNAFACGGCNWCTPASISSVVSRGMRASSPIGAHACAGHAAHSKTTYATTSCAATAWRYLA